MLKDRRVVRSVFFSVLFFAGISCFSAPDVTRKSFSLTEITRQNQLLLTGRNPSQLIYVPLPKQWKLKAINIKLKFNYSPALLPSSTVTVLANNVPLTTMILDKPLQPGELQLAVPANVLALSPRVLNLRLAGYLKLSNDICDDIENEGNWLSIAGDSNITYLYDSSETTYRLQNFPEPFLNPQYPSADNIAFLLPDELSLKDFTPYLKAARFFFSKAGWRGVEFTLKPLGKVDAKLKSNAVIIGTPEAVDFSAWTGQLPLQLENNRWIYPSGKPLEAGKGFIYLGRNKASPDYALLIVSANSTQGIDSALEQLFDNTLHYLANKASFYITQSVPPAPLPEANQGMRTLESLGFADGTVFGSGLQTLSYPVTLTVEEAAHAVDLHVIYSHSPFLSKENASYLMVSMNGKPLDGVTLQPASAAKREAVFNIPAENLKVGENLLELKFDLQLDQTGCKRFQLDRGWGTIYHSSYLTLDASSTNNRLSIKNYPYELTRRVNLALPDENRFYKQNNIPMALLTLVGSLAKNTRLNIVSNQGESQKNLSNVIWVGYGSQAAPIMQYMHRQFSNLVNHLNDTSNRSFRAINTNLFANAFSSAQDVGFVSFVRTEKQHEALILYGYEPNALGFALDLLNNPNKRLTLSGDIAVAFQNGSYTSLSSQEIKQYIQLEKQVTKANVLTLRVILYTLLVLLLALLIFIWVRRRRLNKQ